MKATRVFQLTTLALVAVAAVQAGWWLFDQSSNAMEQVREKRALYVQQVAAAHAMLDSGTSQARVHELLPAIATTDGHAALSSTAEQAMLNGAHRRISQYAREGALFLLAQGACFFLICRALLS